MTNGCSDEQVINEPHSEQSVNKIWKQTAITAWKTQQPGNHSEYKLANETHV